MMVGFATLYERDVSDRQDVWGGYANGEVYETKLDTFLVKANDWNQRLVFVPTLTEDGKRLGMMIHSAPDSVDKYHAEKDEWGLVRGVVPAGTRIEVDAIREHGSAVTTPSLMAFATIMNGEHAGTAVGLSDVSTYYRKNGEAMTTDEGSFLDAPEPRLLRRVQE